MRIELLDPRSGRWSAVAAPPDSGELFAWRAYCAGDRLVVSDQTLENVWTLDLSSEKWTPHGPAPRDVVTQPLPPNNQAPPGAQLAVMFNSTGWTGTGLAFWNAERQVSTPGADGRPGVFPGFAINFDPATGEWSPAVAGPYDDSDGRSFVWTDGYAFAVAGQVGQAPSLAVYQPH